MDIPCVLWYNGSRIETHRDTASGVASKETDVEELLTDIERIQEDVNTFVAMVGQWEQTPLAIRLNTIAACISGLNALARRLGLDALASEAP